jgi:hypothetical protein
MKWIFLTLTASIIFLSSTSCTKTINSTTTVRDTTTIITRDTVYIKSPLNPIVGLWIGKYLNNGDVNQYYYSFDIQASGQCIASAIGPTNNSIATSGPWQLSNKTSFTATLTAMTNSPTPAIQAITAIYDSTAGTLTGQYTYTQGSGVPGTFKLTRVPN